MALTTRATGQQITIAAVNDFKDLLTGVMPDQLITVINNILGKARGAAPAAATAAIAAGGSVDTGAHTYKITFVGNTGEESALGTGVVATTTAGNNTVNLTVIPTGPTGTTARKIYRSKAGTTTPFFLVTTLANNTATTYSDTVADSTLATQAANLALHGGFGGSFIAADSTGATKAQIYNDGAVSFDNGTMLSDGAGNLTLVGITASGNINSNGKAVPYLVPTGASTAGRQIFTGTTAPTGANEGDIWVKA